MLCAICGEKDYKYKCPTCTIFYCSVACWKKHEADKCEAEESVQEEDGILKYFKFKYEDRIPENKLKQLGENEQILELLKNPNLRGIIHKIWISEKPGLTYTQAMTNNTFSKFVDDCLNVVLPNNS